MVTVSALIRPWESGNHVICSWQSGSCAGGRPTGTGNYTHAEKPLQSGSNHGTRLRKINIKDIQRNWIFITVFEFLDIANRPVELFKITFRRLESAAIIKKSFLPSI
jgi:hypothetical protein